MLSELTKLAELNSSEKRRELMNNITELFIQNNEKSTDNEMVLFGEILSKLLNNMGETAKQEISTDFSKLETTPKTFAMALANQSSEVAMPMLRDSTVYSDEELIEISENNDTDHRLAISCREKINSNVTDSLISFGETAVLCSISSNDGADISNNGLRKIVEHASDNQEIATNLVKRVNIFDQLKHVLPTLSANSQDQFSAVLKANNPGELDALMEQANKELTRNKRIKETDKIQAKTEVKKIKQGNIDINSTIINFANNDKTIKLATLFAGFVKMEVQHINNSILQMNSDALVILCKSVNIKEDALKAIGEMRCRILRVPSSTTQKLLTDYKNMDEEASQRTMRFVGLKTNLKKKAGL